MSQADPAHFRCDACGRQFRWRGEIAGRNAKCPCGNTVVCPAQEPAAGGDLYDLAPSQPPTPTPSTKPGTPHAAPKAAVPASPMTSPVSPLRSPSAPAPGASAPLRPLSYATPRKPDPSDVIQLQAPLWILAGGVIVEIAAALLHSGSTGFAAQVQKLGLGLFGSTALMLVAVMIAAKFRGIALGPFWPAVIKLAAIAIGPGAAVDLIRPFLIFIPFGWIGGLILQFVLFFALLGVFFELDESDTWYCLCVMFIINAAASIAIALLWH